MIGRFVRFNSNLVPSSGKKTPQRGGLTMMDPSLSKLLKAKPHYDATKLKEGSSFEFHSGPNPSQQYQHQIESKVKGKSKFQKLLPSLLISGGICWGIFAYHYYTHDFNEEKDTDAGLLTLEKFLPYVVTFNYKIDEDHYLIELTRKNRAEKLLQINQQKLFDGSRIWSIEIAQPDINITRNYTPLPFYVAGVNPTTGKPHLRLVSKLEEEGKFVVIVKRYKQGEMSRWLTSRPLLSTIKVKGPHVEWKPPGNPINQLTDRAQMSNTLKDLPFDVPPENYTPDNLLFYAGGTGVYPALQMLYSPNPPRGFTEVFWSVHNKSEILPQLNTLNHYLEISNRAKIWILDSSSGRRLTEKDIKRPQDRGFLLAQKGWLGFLSNSETVSTESIENNLEAQVWKEQRKRQIKEDIERQLRGEKPLVAHSDAVDVQDQDKDQDSNAQHLSDSRLLKQKDTPPNALQAWIGGLWGKETPGATFALVCGPERYEEFVCGKSDRNNAQGVDRAEIEGIMGDKGWVRGGREGKGVWRLVG